MTYNTDVIQTVLNHRIPEIVLTDFKIHTSLVEFMGMHSYSQSAMLNIQNPYELYEFNFVLDFVELTWGTQLSLMKQIEDELLEKFQSEKNEVSVRIGGQTENHFNDAMHKDFRLVVALKIKIDI